MMRVIGFIILSVILSGCAISPTTALIAVPKTAVSAGPATQSSKVGEAVCWNVLGIAAWGDCSIEAAKKAGGITEVSTVDTDNLGILGLFYRSKVIVKGN